MKWPGRVIVHQVDCLPCMWVNQFLSLASHTVLENYQEKFLRPEPGVTCECHWVWPKDKQANNQK